MIEVNKESPWYRPDMDDMVREANAFKFTNDTRPNIRKGHIRIGHGFFDRMNNKVKQCPLGLYEFLRRYAWNGPHPKDIYKLYYRYYTKGLLVASFPMDKLVKIFGVDKATINRWLKKLRDEGYVEYGDKVGKSGQNTYVLGYIKNGEEVYYADEL